VSGCVCGCVCACALVCACVSESAIGLDETVDLGGGKDEVTVFESVN
jgi:hypothetical protein